MVTRMKNDVWQERIAVIVARQRAQEVQHPYDHALVREQEYVERQQRQQQIDMNYDPLVGMENDWHIAQGARLA